MEETFWNLYARWYDRHRVLIPYMDLMDDVASGLKLGTGRRRALDLGCGTGRLLLRMHELHPEWEFVGLDRSRPMLRAARRRLAYTGMEFLEHDADRGLPFDDASFDGATCVNVLYALRSPDATLREIRRVLLPGGRFLLVNPWKPDFRGIWQEHIREVMRRGSVWHAALTLRYAHHLALITGINAVIARKMMDRSLFFLPPVELRRQVERAGFDVLDLRKNAYAGTCCRVIARAPS